MGYIRHDAVVAVTGDFSMIGLGNGTAKVAAFRETMPEEYRQYLVGPVRGVNSYDFWCFLPDGSKEGWDRSDEVGEWRERFAALVAGVAGGECVGVAFGGDLDVPYISYDGRFGGE